MTNEPEDVGSMSYIYMVSAVAFLFADRLYQLHEPCYSKVCRNAKEIGIRKVTGSNKRLLIWQFLLESTLTALFALLLSIGFIALFLQCSTP